MPFSNNLFKLCILLVSIVHLSSCAGYQLGGSKPHGLQHIDSVYIPLVDNKTQEIKLAPQATNSLIKFINADGTYKVSTLAKADAQLEITIETIEYREFRSARLDTLRAEELTAKIIATWQLLDTQSRTLLKGKSKGETRFFVDRNQRLSRNNALHDAIDNLSRKITSRISNGF